jgi:hypothetical protein
MLGWEFHKHYPQREIYISKSPMPEQVDVRPIAGHETSILVRGVNSLDLAYGVKVEQVHPQGWWDDELRCVSPRHVDTEPGSYTHHSWQVAIGMSVADAISVIVFFSGITV